MSAQQDYRKKRLEEAMKKNILRRKGEDIDDIENLKQKIDSLKNKKIQKKPTNNISYKQIFEIIIDLFAGGLTGLLMGFIVAKIFNIQAIIPMITLFAFGIMGGFYNIAKKSAIKD